jgi:hypothetical protein
MAMATAAIDTSSGASTITATSYSPYAYPPAMIFAPTASSICLPTSSSRSWGFFVWAPYDSGV